LSSPFLLTLVALAALFLVALGADSVLSLLVKYAAKNFVFMPAAIVKATLPFLVVILVLAFAWLTLIRLPPNSPAATAVLVTGITFVVIYLPFAPFSFPLWLRQTPIGSLRAMLWTLEGYATFYYVAAACIVIGIAGIIRTRTP
jgi:hypothetical protein